MNHKFLIAVALFAAIPMMAYAQQDDPAAGAPKPTVADAQKLAQMISSDKAKLKAYCDMGTLQQQMEQAEQKNDQEALEILDAKIDSLAQQIGPHYVRIMAGLQEIDP